MQGYNCDVSPLPYGVCPVMIVDLPWTHAKARAQTLKSLCGSLQKVNEAPKDFEISNRNKIAHNLLF